MANVWAIKSGDWSDTTVWNTGAPPTSADDVYANNFNVNVNQNITVNSLRNTANTGITAGGTFTFNTGGVTADINFNLLMNQTITTTFILITAPSGNVVINCVNRILTKSPQASSIFLTHSGNCNFTITASAINGTSTLSSSSYFLVKTSLGVLTINANILGDVGGNSGSTGIININSNSDTYINGNIKGGGNGLGSRAVIVNVGNLIVNGNIEAGTTNVSYGLVYSANGNLNIVGNVIGGVFAPALFCSNGNINIIGVITGGTSEGVSGVQVGGPSNFNHVGTAQASAYASAIKCDTPTTSIVTCTGPFLKNGYIVAIASQTLRINFGSNSYFQFKKSNGDDIDYVSTVEGYNYPLASDVRYGVEYKSGLAIGTCHVPTPDNVRKNIPVDNTVGTSDNVNAEDILEAIQNSSLPISERLRNVATVESTGAQVAGYG